MKKNYLFLLFAIFCIAGKSSAQVIQPCATDEMHKKLTKQYPELLVSQKQLEEQIQQYMAGKGKRGGGTAERTTWYSHADTDWYDIPVVVHIIHNGGAEVIPDAKIYALLHEMNNFYSLNMDNSAVVPEFKQYIGRPKFRFHLATKDQFGNRSNGITHRLSYLTYGGDEQAKLDQWPQASYVNIWFEYVIGETTPGATVVAYTVFPPDAASLPYRDGIIENYSFISDSTGSGGRLIGSSSIDHEMGHYFYLNHTFGTSNDVHTNKSGSCTDDDGVDDTPPTEGNLGTCNLKDTVCATNYFKIYSKVTDGTDSLVNYPDTANEQNTMNYADCPQDMFTKGQVTRMRALLNSTIASRNNIWDSLNLVNTGALLSRANIPATAEFIVTPVSGTTVPANYMQRMAYFTFPGTSVAFHNLSWNDSLKTINWKFSNGATIKDTTTIVKPVTSILLPITITNAFSIPGWDTLTMEINGAWGGDNTTVFPKAVFVADAVGTPAAQLYQNFQPGNTDKWPSFNYYNNAFKWQPANTGLYDNYSMMYTGFDTTINPTFGLYPTTGTPKGDFDDFFSVPVDFTGYTVGNCSFNYDYSGATRSSLSLSLTDTLFIDYSVNKSQTWTNMAKLTKGTLANKGSLTIPYVPLYYGDWSHMSINVPAAAITDYTVFRFRYEPGVGQPDMYGNSYSSGNNFYIDNINIRPYPASVANIELHNGDIAVVPNPTNGDATVVLKDAENTVANIVVTDITGKVVYKTSEQITSNEAHIVIPRSAISVQGMYIVQAATGSKIYTQKLVVY